MGVEKPVGRVFHPRPGRVGTAENRKTKAGHLRDHVVVIVFNYSQMFSPRGTMGKKTQKRKKKKTNNIKFAIEIRSQPVIS